MLADTNFLLRALEAGESEHNLRARERISALRDKGEKAEILPSTVLELVYVLESKKLGYGWPANKIAEAVTALVEEPATNVHEEVISLAAGLYLKHHCDFHDCYLAAFAKRKHAKVLSFESDLQKLGVGAKP